MRKKRDEIVSMGMTEMKELCPCNGEGYHRHKIYNNLIYFTCSSCDYEIHYMIRRSDPKYHFYEIYECKEKNLNG